MSSGRRRLRIAFVMEQVLGHVTWYENLRAAISERDDVVARWIPTTLYNPNGVVERLPALPAYLRASMRALLDVRQGLAGQHFDVLVFNTQKAAALCQWQMWRTPTILMTDVTPLQYDRMAGAYDHAADAQGVIHQAKHAANRWNFRLAQGVAPWSSWTRDSFRHDYGVPPERLHVIPPGVDTRRWQPAATRPAERGGGKVRLLFVGGNFERKGGALLLDVFRAQGWHERAELHIVTRDAVPPAPGVVVHRNLANNSPALMDLYHRADAFVLPTLADCFSIASIEAMAAGLPVVTSDVGGIADIVQHEGTGFLLPPGDGQALCRALGRLLDDPCLRARFSRCGRERAVTMFDARRSAGRVVELAGSLARRPS